MRDPADTQQAAMCNRSLHAGTSLLIPAHTPTVPRLQALCSDHWSSTIYYYCYGLLVINYHHHRGHHQSRNSRFTSSPASTNGAQPTAPLNGQWIASRGFPIVASACPPQCSFQSGPCCQYSGSA
jgi:hypothetical protein